MDKTASLNRSSEASTLSATHHDSTASLSSFGSGANDGDGDGGGGGGAAEQGGFSVNVGGLAAAAGAVPLHGGVRLMELLWRERISREDFDEVIRIYADFIVVCWHS